MSHNYQLNLANAGSGKPRVLELWDGSNRICALTSPDESDERLQLDLEPLIEAANPAEGEDELKDRISELEDQLRDGCEDCNAVLELKSENGDLKEKISELEEKISAMEAAQ